MPKPKPKQLTQLTVAKVRYHPEWGNPTKSPIISIGSCA